MKDPFSPDFSTALQPNVVSVEGANEPKNEEETAQGSDLSAEEIERVTREAEELITSYRRFFATFAGDVSLTFHVGNAFKIDLESGDITTAGSWFAERGYNRDQILWAHMHELAHFIDFSRKPEDFFENVDHLMEKARATGAQMMQKWEAAYGASNPDFIEQIKKQEQIDSRKPGLTLSQVEKAAFTMYHRFYNALDDIVVNAIVARRAARYDEDGPGAESVRDLYRQKLFPGTDYSKNSRHSQLGDALLREEMVPEDAVTVSDDVGRLLSSPIEFRGKQLTPKQIIEGYLMPSASGRIPGMKQRAVVIRETLEPLFDELLNRDLEEWQPQMPPPTQVAAGNLNPYDGEYKERGDSNPDQFDIQDIIRFVRGEKEERDRISRVSEARDELEDGMSPEDRARRAQNTLDKEWCRDNMVSPQTLAEFRRIEREVEPYLQELSAVWHHIVYGSSREVNRSLEGWYPTGIELDMQRTIDEWPRIASGEFGAVRPMKRVVAGESPVLKPELIRVRLLGDVSMSMTKERMKVLEQCFVLLLSSLREFRRMLDLTRRKTKAKLTVDTEAWMYGGSYKKIKPLKSESGLEDDQVEIVKIFDALRKTRPEGYEIGRMFQEGTLFDIGSTNDHLPLGAINESIDDVTAKKMREGKIMEIIFEVTDGGSTASMSARSEVDSLIGKGVIAKAFQISDGMSAHEKAIFDSVWNDDRSEVNGVQVLNIAQLLPGLAEALKHYLRDVRL